MLEHRALSCPESDSLVPVQAFPAGSGVTAISPGHLHTCAVVSGGARCWGFGPGLGNGDTYTPQEDTPVQVSGLTSGVTDISAGGTTPARWSMAVSSVGA